MRATQTSSSMLILLSAARGKSAARSFGRAGLGNVSSPAELSMHPHHCHCAFLPCHYNYTSINADVIIEAEQFLAIRFYFHRGG